MGTRNFCGAVGTQSFDFFSIRLLEQQSIQLLTKFVFSWESMYPGGEPDWYLFLSRPLTGKISPIVVHIPFAPISPVRLVAP